MLGLNGLPEGDGRRNLSLRRTEDPLLDGPVPPAEGTVVNTVDQISASDPTTPPSANSLTHTRRTGSLADSED